MWRNWGNLGGERAGIVCLFLEISGIIGTAGWGEIGACAYLLIINAEKAQALRGIASLF